MTATKEQVIAAINLILVVAECIRDLKEVPSGHLYAQICGQMTLSEYNYILSVLKDSGRIKESNHLITWVAE